MNSLEKTVNTVLDNFEKATNEFPWENRQAYAHWLAQTYYFVLHSTRLLALAASRFDLASEPYHLRFLDHLKEERGHEKLAIRDIQQLGLDIKDLPELTETSAFYQVQYYWIEHVHPLSFFGYILGLEGIAVRAGKQIYQKISKAHGEKAGMFVKVHAQEDEGHLAIALETLRNIDPKARQQIEKNLVLSCDLYQKMLRDIAQKHSVERAKTAA